MLGVCLVRAGRVAGVNRAAERGVAAQRVRAAADSAATAHRPTRARRRSPGRIGRPRR